MNRFLLLTVALTMLLSAGAYAQLIGEGDTLWYKGGFPEIRQVQFTPDGTKLGVLGAVDIGVFTMYDALNGNELWTFKKSITYFYQFTYSLDGSKVYILPPEEKQINIIDVNTGIILDSLPFVTKITTYGYGQVYQTKNPNILLLANGTRCFALYNIAERKIIKERVGNLINKIFACPYSDYFINAYQYESSNKWKTKIEMYDINTLDFVATLGEEEALVQSGEAKISYNGKYAATNFGTRALQIWDLENKKLYKEYSPTIKTETTSGGGPQPALAFCHDNENIINCGGYYIDDTKGASSTITNYLNDKRAFIYYNMTGFTAFDVNKTDSQLAAVAFRNLTILKLKKDAVPVKEYPKEPNEIIYPNPTTGNVSVNIPKQFGIIKNAQICDNTGRVIKSLLPNELNYSGTILLINLYEIQSGSYVLNLFSEKDTISYKIILER